MGPAIHPWSTWYIWRVRSHGWGTYSFPVEFWNSLGNDTEEAPRNFQMFCRTSSQVLIRCLGAILAEFWVWFGEEGVQPFSGGIPREAGTSSPHSIYDRAFWIPTWLGIVGNLSTWLWHGYSPSQDVAHTVSRYQKWPCIHDNVCS